ncbi:hypothetical protein AAIH46_13295 [Rhizobium sp. 0TCS1.26]|uniref:hypothetical protein n=1 Tax=Rhizobium sp. 0TCS1.26 TaxID=3142623 RepID=UPI003D2E0DFF
MSEDDEVIEHDIEAWFTLDGKFAIEEADVYAGGMKWRVHKNDADPFPSSPHAHCIAGQERHVGCKLHLGTGVLFKGRSSWKKMGEADFNYLIGKIRPKFPGVELPIPQEDS